MSWDIHVSDLPDVKSVEDIPDDFRPVTLGSRAALIEKICEVFPVADFNDPSWGIIDGDGWSIEVNIGRDAECNGIMLHVRGNDGAVPAVTALLDRIDLRALDLQSGNFFDPGLAAQSFGSWRAYRDHIVSSSQN